MAVWLTMSTRRRGLGISNIVDQKSPAELPTAMMTSVVTRMLITMAIAGARIDSPTDFSENLLVMPLPLRSWPRQGLAASPQTVRTGQQNDLAELPGSCQTVRSAHQ